MKTKWLVGVVGIALLLGMMAGCSVSGGDPIQGQITVTKTASFNYSPSEIKVGNIVATLDVAVPVTGQSHVVSVKYPVYDGNNTLTKTVEIKNGDSVTVTAKRLANGTYTLE